MKKNIIALIFATFFIIGCAKNSISTTLPSWYINPPSNSALFLYGTGEGFNLKEAKANALNDLSSKLLVTVSSTLEVNKSSSSDGIYDKKSTQNIKLEIEKIRYSNVQIPKSEIIDGQHYVLVKVNRQKQFEQQKKAFDYLDNKISKKINNTEKDNIYRKILNIKKSEKNIQKNRDSALILYALNNDFTYTLFLKKYDDFLNLSEELKQKMKISVQSNEQSNYFKNRVIEMLNSKKYIVTTTQNPDIVVEIVNKANHSKSSSWKIAKVNTTLNIKKSGKIRNKKIYNTTGRSTSSKKSAMQEASLEFLEYLQEEEIDNLLFNY